MVVGIGAFAGVGKEALLGLGVGVLVGVGVSHAVEVSVGDPGVVQEVVGGAVRDKHVSGAGNSSVLLLPTRK